LDGAGGYWLTHVGALATGFLGISKAQSRYI